MSKGKQHEAEASEGARRATAEASASWALVGTGAVVRATKSLRGHRGPQGGITREPQSSPWRDGGEALAVA